MRLRTFGIGAAALLAGSTVAFTSGVQHAAAACPNGLPAQVYAGAGQSQIGGTGATVVGVCVDTGTGPARGGWLEAGTGNGTQAYAIAQGNANNSVAPNGADKGYAGISNYETGTTGWGPQDAPGCASQPGSGSNSGGSFGVKALCNTTTGVAAIDSLNLFSHGLPLPIACGNVSSKTWGSTTRDGCWVP